MKAQMLAVALLCGAWLACGAEEASQLALWVRATGSVQNTHAVKASETAATTTDVAPVAGKKVAGMHGLMAPSTNGVPMETVNAVMGWIEKSRIPPRSLIPWDKMDLIDVDIRMGIAVHRQTFKWAFIGESNHGVSLGPYMYTDMAAGVANGFRESYTGGLAISFARAAKGKHWF